MVSDRPAVQVEDPFLAELLEQLDAVLLDARSLTESLTRTQINWRPAPGRWSIAQCIDHLTRSVRLYPEAIERMIREARARAAAGEGPYREGMLARWVITGMEPPPKMRVRTIRRAEPDEEYDPREVLAEFEAAYGRLRDLIVASDGVPLDHARMRSPFFRLARFTLRQALVVNLAHARRHLWQARQVRQHAAFPSANGNAERQP